VHAFRWWKTPTQEGFKWDGTSICWRFNAGYCSHGDECRFTHVYSEPAIQEEDRQIDPFNLKQHMKVISDKFYEIAADSTKTIHPCYRKNLHELKKLFDPNDPTTKVEYRMKPPSRVDTGRYKDLWGIWQRPRKKFRKSGWRG